MWLLLQMCKVRPDVDKVVLERGGFQTNWAPGPNYPGPNCPICLGPIVVLLAKFATNKVLGIDIGSIVPLTMFLVRDDQPNVLLMSIAAELSYRLVSIFFSTPDLCFNNIFLAKVKVSLIFLVSFKN